MVGGEEVSVLVVLVMDGGECGCGCDGGGRCGQVNRGEEGSAGNLKNAEMSDSAFSQTQTVIRFSDFGCRDGDIGHEESQQVKAR